MLVINSTVEKVPFLIFLVVEAIYVYWFLFILGYIVAVMKNCIELLALRDAAETSVTHKTIYETANEIRIDIIYELLYRKMSAEDTHDSLMTIINNRIDMMDVSIDEKEKVRKYLEDFYRMENEK